MRPILTYRNNFILRSSSVRCLASAVCCFVCCYFVDEMTTFCGVTDMTEEEDSISDKQIVSIARKLFVEGLQLEYNTIVLFVCIVNCCCFLERPQRISVIQVISTSVVSVIAGESIYCNFSTQCELHRLLPNNGQLHELKALSIWEHKTNY